MKTEALVLEHTDDAKSNKKRNLRNPGDLVLLQYQLSCSHSLLHLRTETFNSVTLAALRTIASLKDEPPT
jgi:hypothetical protein